MAQNFASKYSNVVDEIFSLASVTDQLVNKGIRLDFNGVNAVTFYGVSTVDEVDYIRSGNNRFGAVQELGTTKQTKVLSQDKAFTFSIDRGNYEDSMMVTESGKALKRQIEKKSVPNTDIYRLTVAIAHAVTNNYAITASAVSGSNAYNKITEMNYLLDEAEVPSEGRYVFVNSTYAKFLKQDSTFVLASDKGQDIKIKGLVGYADGAKVIQVPARYLPSTQALMIHEEVLIAPHKLANYRILKEYPGIDGWVVEGRRYFDCFVPSNRGVAMAVSKAS